MTFRQFKKLPDEFQVWFSLGERTGNQAARPHCFLLWQERFGFLVHIADVSQPIAESALQGTLFEDDKSITVAELGREESMVLEGFSDGLRSDLGEDFPLRKLVVFPSVSHETIAAIALQRGDSGVRFLGLKLLNPQSLPNYLSEMAEAALPEPGLLQLRRSFNPETRVPHSFSTLAVQERNTRAALTAGLLDLDQEWCMKHDLHLPEEAGSLVDGYVPRRNQLVTGVAGSGKSLVLLYRTLLNARLNPGASVLLLTHNRPLNFELQRRAEALGGAPRNVECLTFFQWARRELMRIGDWEKIDGKIVYPDETNRLLGNILRGEETSLSVSFLVDEIGWIKDNNLRHKRDYLEVERSGRGTALRAAGREEVWGYFRQYQKKLESDGQIDWHGIAMRFHEAATSGRLRFPAHDCILIDEAQFFAKAWFDVVNAALEPGGQLFLAADPTQGFLRRRQSWLASGIDVRGRTTRLRQAYRNSRQILEFAAAFFKSRSGDGDGAEVEELNLPDPEQIAATVIEGIRPEIVLCPSEQDVRVRLVNELIALKGDGLENGQVLVLCSNSSPKWVGEEIGKGLGGMQWVHLADMGKRPAAAFCQVSSLAAATGLEAAIVFLIGAEELVERASAAELSKDEQRENQRDVTRKLYMAFTRAGQRLVVLTRSQSLYSELQALVDGR
ncbi:MAG: hypothetical protein ACI8XO_004926 [Verrucomicrobiales bacterium]|jgi:hypothetical protein